MRTRYFVIAVATTVLVAGTGHAAPTEAVLYKFQGGADGGSPHGALVIDASGDVWGATLSGGSTACPGGCGTLFKLTRNARGVYSKHLFYAFQGGSDGSQPSGSLVRDAAGNFYGTTLFGGAGFGTVFRITPGKVLTTLHTFAGNPDATGEGFGLIFDAAGNLIGTSINGGSGTPHPDGGGGTLYELTPPAGGGSDWGYAIRYHFRARGPTGPAAPVILGRDGLFYGTTFTTSESAAGVQSLGNVYSINPHKTHNGDWFLRAVGFFPEGTAAGIYPDGPVVQDAAGNLYGTVPQAPEGDFTGAAYELVRAPPPGNDYAQVTLHSFTYDEPHMLRGLVADQAGNLFGAGYWGGHGSTGSANQGRDGNGGVVELVKQGSSYTLNTLWLFNGGPSDGANPTGQLVADGDGALYGVTDAGGHGYGVVFRVTP